MGNKKKREKAKLRFTPYAWAKLLHFLEAGPTEVGGFGVSGVEEDPLLVTDFAVVKQKCSGATVKFDDAAVADFTDDAVDAGMQPWQVSRIWIHTHPGSSPNPSFMDEDTFDRGFGDCDWSVMFIIARNQAAYARLVVGDGQARAEQAIPVEVDYRADFGHSDGEAWGKEYKEKVTEEVWQTALDTTTKGATIKGVPVVPGAPLVQGGLQSEAWRKSCYGAGVSPVEQGHSEFMGAELEVDEASRYAHDLGYEDDPDDWWTCLSNHEKESIADLFDARYDWQQGVWYYEPIERIA
jgi:proteasome lid subunit RPN8/RPN11